MNKYTLGYDGFLYKEDRHGNVYRLNYIMDKNSTNLFSCSKILSSYTKVSDNGRGFNAKEIIKRNPFRDTNDYTYSKIKQIVKKDIIADTYALILKGYSEEHD